MAFRLYGKNFPTLRHAVAFAATRSGMDEKFARPTLELLEQHFDGASRKEQFLMAKALANTIKWQPNRARRILQFVGRYVQESALAKPADPGTHFPKETAATRRHLRDIMLKLVQSGQGRATIRFAKRHYRHADDVSKGHILDALQRVANYRGVPKKPDPSTWILPRNERRHQAAEERDGVWFPEHADAIVRLAQKHAPAAESDLQSRWVDVGIAAMESANTRPTLEFIESQFQHADSNARQAMTVKLLIHGSGGSAGRVMEIARRLNRQKDPRRAFSWRWC